MLHSVDRAPIELWLEAMRSGRWGYNPGGRLKDHGTYNAFGTACEVAIENGVSVPTEHYGHYGRYASSEYCLPRPVREWLGLKCLTGALKHEYHGAFSLYDWECTYKPTASEMADFIEQMYREGNIHVIHG